MKLTDDPIYLAMRDQRDKYRAERDRYREALKTVCDVGDRAAVQVASDALNQKDS